jgi:hypothetical protein
MPEFCIGEQEKIVKPTGDPVNKGYWKKKP